ncbi:MAG: hypothetical protein AAGA23_02910 [Pseudomonadota bacterium]
MAELSRTVRGGRKAFFDDPNADRLLAMLARLLESHWALRERCAVLEKLLVSKGVLGPLELEAFELDAEADAALDAESAELIRDVLGAARNIEP